MIGSASILHGSGLGIYNRPFFFDVRNVQKRCAENSEKFITKVGNSFTGRKTVLSIWSNLFILKTMYETVGKRNIMNLASDRR